MNDLPVSDSSVLDLSRRVDWRFLLPSPALGHVAVLGEGDAELLKALRTFSVSVTQHPAVPDAEDRHYDLVVTAQSSPERIGWAATLAPPRAVLYAEVDRRALPRSERLRHPAHYVRILERLGFADVEIYWHWPDFTRCTTICPLFDHTALALAIERSGSSLADRLRAAGGRVALTAGLIPWLIRCFSLVAIKSGQE
jgi:hypothetical protein